MSKLPHTSGWKRAWMAGAIATELTITVVGSILLGALADRWWGTKPFAMLMGILVGSIVGLVLFFRRIMSVKQTEKTEG